MIPGWKPPKTLLYPVSVSSSMKWGCMENGLTYYWASENPSLSVVVAISV